MKLYKLTCQALKQINDTIIARAGSKLPDFIIVGAQKCGTTTLHYSLRKHPDIFMPKSKELDFFEDDDNFRRGTDWYCSFFKCCPSHCIAGEASPEYSHYEQVPERISNTLPSVKIIILLRNPVDRAYSGYWHSVRIARENLPFAQAIKIESERIRKNSYNMKFYSYLYRGHYFKQIKPYFDFFNTSQILVIISEEYFSNPTSILQQITEFVGVSCDQKYLNRVRNVVRNEGRAIRFSLPPKYYPFLRERVPFMARVLNKLNKKKDKYPPMNRETRRFLESFYSESNLKLERMLDRDLSIWKNTSE